MRTELQVGPHALWKQRFRVTETFTKIAATEPTRGLAASNRSGVFQLYAWDVLSGALTQLTHNPKGKPGGVLAPDGRFVYYFDDKDGNELGHWVRVPFEGGEAQDVTPNMAPFASWSFSISRAGNRAGFQQADQEGFHFYWMDQDADGTLSEPRLLYHTPSLAYGPTLSYSGEYMLIRSSERAKKPQFSVLAFDVEQGKQIAELWDGPETSIDDVRFSPLPGDFRVLASSNRTGVKRPLLWDIRSGERRDLVLDTLEGEIEIWAWSHDARHVLLCNVRAAVQQLFLYDLEQETHTRLAHPNGTFWGAYFAGNNEIFTHWTDSAHPPHLIALDAASGAQTRVVMPVGELPPGRSWRSVTFASSDGTPIQAWVATPEGEGPFPTILNTHGGPAGVTMDGFDPDSQTWLDHGFAYMSVNYRGSTTFGKAFEEQIWGDLGHWEIEDMVAARDWLVNNRIAEPDAILLTGWSYGGYLTLMGLGKRPDLWAGGMAGVAIADWSIQYEDTADTLKGYQVAILGGTPEEQPEIYARSSPITYAGHVQAPVLVIQGRNDTRCPARPMEQYEQKMRALGKQIEVEWFEAGHGSYETEQRIAHQELMLRFAYRVLG